MSVTAAWVCGNVLESLAWLHYLTLLDGQCLSVRRYYGGYQISHCLPLFTLDTPGPYDTVLTVCRFTIHSPAR